MKCVILAAGEGKRTRPLTYTRPKVMLPIGNKPILEWNLQNALNAGLKEFIFVIGYKSEMVRNFFGNGEKWGAHIEYVNQSEALGTAHAIGMIEKFVEDFVVLCGDTIFGQNEIKKIAEKRKTSIGLTKAESAHQYGIVDIDRKKVIKIYEKMEEPFSDIINAGIYFFQHNIFDFIKKTDKSPRGEYEITESINLFLRKEDMEYIFLNEWRDVVYPWHLIDANEEVLKKIHKKVDGEIEENVTIKGNVIVGRNSTILSRSYIEGPAVIGNNCKVGPNCYIRPYTSIGDGCHIGNACEVKNSIIMNNSNIPHQNYVGDSIIGENCNLGAGTKIANLRMDKHAIMVFLNGIQIATNRRKLGAVIGDNIQTGINSMLNVGSMIGNDVFIGPGAIAQGEIKPKARIF
jgi:bifunctional UDP-N-acetylglucosamine pyrophosphorylase/glucosamine-1-phosphate N-acetyltransferase